MPYSVVGSQVRFPPWAAWGQSWQAHARCSKPPSPNAGTARRRGTYILVLRTYMHMYGVLPTYVASYIPRLPARRNTRKKSRGRASPLISSGASKTARFRLTRPLPSRLERARPFGSSHQSTLSRSPSASRPWFNHLSFSSRAPSQWYLGCILSMTRPPRLASLLLLIHHTTIHSARLDSVKSSLLFTGLRETVAFDI